MPPPAAPGYAYSGAISYDLLAATSPTYDIGRTDPGVFEADLTVEYFATDLRATLDGTIIMPDATYAITGTTGTFAQDGFTGLMQGDFSGGGVDGRALIKYGIGGENAGERVGITYLGEAEAFSITGAALFGVPGTYTPGGDNGGGMNGGADLTGFTGTLDLVGVTYLNGGERENFAGPTTLDDGVITAYTSNQQTTLADLSSGNGMLAGSGSASDLAWARWSSPGQPGNGAFDDYHIFAGTPVVNMPTSGRIDFEQIGSTGITDNIGNDGTITGDAAMIFDGANDPRIGLELAIDIGIRSYTAQTSGGVADPSNSVLRVDGTGRFAGALGEIMPSGGGDCSFGCGITVSGYTFGDGVQQIGMGVSLNENNTDFSEGTIHFGRESAQPAGNAPALNQTASAQHNAGEAWDRWSVPSASLTTDSNLAMAAPGLGALAAQGIEFSPEQIQMLAAHLQTPGN